MRIPIDAKSLIWFRGRPPQSKPNHSLPTMHSPNNGKKAERSEVERKGAYLPLCLSSVVRSGMYVAVGSSSIECKVDHGV